MTGPWLGAPPGLLRVSERLHDDILAHLRGALPHEGVGLLAVHGLAEGRAALEVTRFYPGTNAEASASRFTMDPTDVIAAFRDIDERGWRLGAIVHSHPHGPAVPSPTDLREARYPDALMVIVSLAAPVPEIGAWWIGSPGERLVPVRVPVEVR
ncbi:MAG: M67 family metallopeptidase [Chloroflexia bacterium]|nr:M67 family metallopeptidase [Chloroflexia bacterium]